MARGLTAAMAAAIAAGTVRPVILYEGYFAVTGSPSPDTLRLWSGYGELSWDGKAWRGAGDLIAITPVSETTDITAQSFAVSLNGQNADLVSKAIEACRQGLLGRVYVGFYDAAGALIVDPFLAFSGRLDVPDITMGGDQVTITVSYESRLIDLDRPRERRYTDEDQQADYAGDLGFEYVPALQDPKIPWGSGIGVQAMADFTARLKATR